MTNLNKMPGKKLLVADDSLTIQKVIRLALSNEGYEIQAVSDGNDAIQQMSLFRPDVVLIDVSLPGKSAFEVKREVNAEPDLQEIRFVLMSSAFEKVDEAQADEVQFHGRLTKPFDPAHLRQVLSDVLAQAIAKRMEKTSILTQTPLEASADPALPAQELPDESANLSDWETTLKPEFPTLPTPPLSETDELWEPAQDPNLGAGLPPPPIEAHPTPPQFTPPPPPNRVLFPNDSPSFSEDVDIRKLTESTMLISGMDDFQWNVQEPSIKPLPHMMESEPLTPPAPPPPEDARSEVFASPSVSTQQIESLIQQQVNQQVEATLAKLAQSLLPEIAERLIKQEIHRLLSE